WIYPNPSTGLFQVRLYNAGPVTEKRKVSIFNVNGQLMTEKEFYLDNVSNPYLQMDFDLSRFAAGTYVVKVNNTISGKIVSGLVVIQ
ncbi:MAG: T9SS type A sorting domain-containing protein, partial [Bacteroidota bacterium]